MQPYMNIYMRQARLLQDNKLALNKEHMRKLMNKEKCWKLAKEFSGDDLSQFNDVKLRIYIRDTFGDDLRLFTDGIGEIVVDIEHTLLLYHKIINSGDNDKVKKAFGLMYYVAGRQLYQEFEELIKTSIRGYIAPIFDLDPKTYRWKRCNHVLRKYALFFTIPEGYKGYYFEKPNLAQIAFICSLGKTVQEAQELIKGIKTGIFYNYLSKDVENRLAPEILGGNLNYLNGVYTKDYEKLVRKLDPKQINPEIYSVYTERVKPIMIELIGMAMYQALNEIRSKNLSPEEARIYHVSPFRFGILIKDNLDIKDALPRTGAFFNKVAQPNLRDLVLGVYM